MRVFIQNSHVMLAQQRRHSSQIRLIASGEDQGRFLADKFRQPPVSLQMQFQRAIEKTRAGNACAVPFGGFDSCLFDPFISRQAQIIIGTQHDNLFVLKGCRRAFRITKRAKKRIDAHFHRFFGDGEAGYFVE